jgi:tRNA pseudouridine32 synthase/23S rRNA pseudouridine746 synthase
VPEPAGDIALPLLADWPNRPRQRVDLERGKPSLTRYAVLGRDPHRHTTRLALTPLTGRSHQLRVHMQALGHPILGDALYAPAEVIAQASRLLLHAQTLAFAHPVSGDWMRFEAPAPF